MGLFMQRLSALALIGVALLAEAARRPNIVVFVADDLGYADLETFGNADQGRNAIDQMAEEGMKFTNWIATAPMCSPSRASLLTGRYPFRTGIYGNTSTVFAPRSRGGLPSSETTLAEALKEKGYATGMVGKWHLGINEASNTDGVHLPHNHGFDSVGTNLPHGQSSACDPSTQALDDMKDTCFLYEGSTIVEQPLDVKDLSEKLRNDAISFVRSNKDGPFLLYLAFPHVHNALFCNSQFCGSSASRGAYGDNINEMAWIVGGVLDEIVSLGIEQDTLAIFSSDHGAQSASCQSQTANSHTNGPFRGGKSTTWEGGFRVPTIAWWPGTIAPGSTSDSIVSHMDIMPTAAYLAGGNCYLNKLKRRVGVMDGQLIPELVMASPSPRESVFYYCSERLFAVRYDHYKIHYYTMGAAATTNGCKSEKGDFACFGDDIVAHDPPLVYDLDKPDGQSETTPEDPTSSVTQDVISQVALLVQAQAATVSSLPPSQVDLGGEKALIPCCDSSCTCNYEGI